MRIRTRLTDLLGIELPIAQAPIGGASTPELVAAVSNAGGLGVLSITWSDLDATRAAIRRTKSLTGRPFGVNLVLHWNPEERLEIALAEGVRVISLFWGDPSAHVERIHRAGSLVTHMVGSAAEARSAVDAGVDIVVAQGWEAGGRVRGSVAALPLIPQVVDAVPEVPVIAAGGIADGRGVAAALTLGAAGAWLGTRFVMSNESAAHPLYQEKLIAADATDTVYGELFAGDWSNAPLRTLRNSTVRAWEAAGRPALGSRPGEGDVVGLNRLGQPVQRYSSDGPLIGAEGNIEAMVLIAGQSAGSISDVRPAGEIVRQLAEETAAALRQASETITLD